MKGCEHWKRIQLIIGRRIAILRDPVHFKLDLVTSEFLSELSIVLALAPGRARMAGKSGTPYPRPGCQDLNMMIEEPYELSTTDLMRPQFSGSTCPPTSSIYGTPIIPTQGPRDSN